MYLYMKMLYPILLILWAVQKCVSLEDRRQLITILLDGARWDYVEMLHKDQRRGFTYFKERGVQVEYVTPVFPSNSYPGWTTLSTGLYPENHGIIGDNMYDMGHDQEFLLGHHNSTKLDLWWQDAEPIWTTATRAGLKVATMHWARSDIPVREVLPLRSTGFTDSWSNITEDILQALGHLQNGFHLVMLQYGLVDATGHSYGPDSPMMKECMTRVGSALNTLFIGLRNANLIDNVDVIIVSGHGMTSSCCLPEIYPNQIKDIVKHNTIKITYENALLGIFCKPGTEREIYNQVKHISGYNLYYKNDIPDKFHYKLSPRAPDLLMTTKCKQRTSCRRKDGTHGFDPDVDDMRGLFLAFGNSFQGESLIHPPLSLVDIYQIYCWILGIDARPNNGSWDRVKFMLASAQNDRLQLKKYLRSRKAFTLQWGRDYYKPAVNIRAPDWRPEDTATSCSFKYELCSICLMVLMVQVLASTISPVELIQ